MCFLLEVFPNISAIRSKTLLLSPYMVEIFTVQLKYRLEKGRRSSCAISSFQLLTSCTMRTYHSQRVTPREIVLPVVRGELGHLYDFSPAWISLYKELLFFALWILYITEASSILLV